jgi:hypothetical protein
MRDDQPFDQDKERRDPWHPDESYRLISRDATEQDVPPYHRTLIPMASVNSSDDTRSS